jgi:GcrA cell cycle regulator
VSHYTVAQLSEMKRLWQAGASSRDIIARFPELELTRNAVLGLAHRKGWGSNGNGPAASRARPQKGPQKDAPVPPARTCQYPHGDPKDPGFRFCGKRAKTGKSYCEEHCAVCYRRPKHPNDTGG